MKVDAVDGGKRPEFRYAQEQRASLLTLALEELRMSMPRGHQVEGCSFGRDLGREGSKNADQIAGEHDARDVPFCLLL